MKKLSALGFAVSLTLAGMSGAQAADVLNVNLLVPNQITITALPGVSSVTASGTTLTGFYLANFFSGVGALGSAQVGVANLTAASVASDGSPLLFRAGVGGSDPGLNVWSYSATSTTTFTAGVTAFTGSATWSLSPAAYAAAVAGATGGSVYFPADDVGDLPSARIIGTYTVTAVPEPATAALLGVGALGLLLYRRRVQDCA